MCFLLITHRTHSLFIFFIHSIKLVRDSGPHAPDIIIILGIKRAMPLLLLRALKHALQGHLRLRRSYGEGLTEVGNLALDSVVLSKNTFQCSDFIHMSSKRALRLAQLLLQLAQCDRRRGRPIV